MTPERLNALAEYVRRRKGTSARQVEVANFLGVTPRTLQRWLRGSQPIPRAIEILVLIFERSPGAINRVVRDLSKP